jgi:hypothetical protein
MGKRYLLKIFLEWGEGAERRMMEGAKFKYDMFDLL